MNTVIIVEGKNDRLQLQNILTSEVTILCTFGIPSTERLERLKKKVRGDAVYILVDNDAAGRRIRRILDEAFPDAKHIYTRKGYHGVEGTPLDFLSNQLEKAGLEKYMKYTPREKLFPFSLQSVKGLKGYF